MSNTMEDSEAPLLDTNVDQLAPAEPADLGDVCPERRRRTSKQPPGGKRRREEEKVKSKAKSKKPSRRARAVSDDDDDDDDEEEGEDEDDEPPQAPLETTGKDDQNVDGSQVDVKESEVDEEKMADVIEEKTCEENPKDERDDGKKRRPKAKEKAKAKAKAKGRSKTQASQSNDSGEGLRDQSKSKKWAELWDSIPGKLQQHWLGLSRSDQTDFVHAGIERSHRGRLSLNTEVLFKMAAERKEVQKGKELMDGCNYEDIGQNAQVLCMDNSPTPLLNTYLMPTQPTPILPKKGDTNTKERPHRKIPFFVPFFDLGSRGIVLEEALAKCQNNPDILNKALMEGRVLRTKVKGIYIYWWPHYQYSRSNVFENKVSGETEKESGDIGDLFKAQETQMGFSWGASGVIGEGLEGIAAICDAGPTQPTQTHQPLQSLTGGGQ